jgi:hypothetical protein
MITQREENLSKQKSDFTVRWMRSRQSFTYLGSRRCRVREPCDRMGNQALDRGAVVIALGRELVGACGAGPLGVIAIAFRALRRAALQMASTRVAT